ncbi:MAG: signal peptidase I [Actinomycetaceae bacterium]|nr:signal peptidase I [Actinomycetaceae bacterium]
MAKRGEWKKQHPILGFLVETLTIFVVAVMVAAVVNTFVFQPFRIPSSSMENTLRIKDRVIAIKYDKKPQRGQVVVFADSQGWLAGQELVSQTIGDTIQGFLERIHVRGSGQFLIKRVIGVGGDKVECCTPSGKLRVNGVEVNEPYLKPGVAPSAVPFSVVVPAGHYWMMGDNREHSGDSRLHINDGKAFVPAKDIVGVAKWVAYPLNRIGKIPESADLKKIGKK